ncbi:PQQ-binding-like beta-propeller repeat protein [Haladaptatus sp. GCM10025707]|uniref:outer membrane protein assembly factor BamB family protein n=1 Tax=unclassified Haladaptatus TaxID=2622732 RepID=UPI0023E8A5BB|nr:PQQ-binding-like beta-propeller repeat protein [Haladaptatus sp. QDMS2]
MRRTSRRTLLKGIGVAGAAGLIGTNAMATETAAGGTDWPTAFSDDGRTSYTSESGLGPYAALDFHIHNENQDGSLQYDPHPPVVKDGAVFVTTQYKDTFETHGEVVAFDATGEGMVWYETEDIGWVTGPPTVTDDTVYVTTQSALAEPQSDGSYYEPNKGGLLAFDKKTGERKWTFKKREHWQGSPVVHDGTVYAVSGGYRHEGSLYALNPDGTEKWQISGGGSTLARVGETLYTAGAAVGTDGTVKQTFDYDAEGARADTLVATEDHLYLTGDKDTVWAISTDDGSVAWEAQVAPDMADSTANRISAPATGNGLVIVTSYDEENTVSAAHALNVATGEEQWQYVTEAELVSRPSATNNISRPTVTDDTVYVGGRFISVQEKQGGTGRNATQFALDAESGEKQWAFAFAPQFDNLKALAAAQADGRLYVTLSTEGIPPWGSRGSVGVLKPSDTEPGKRHRVADDTPQKPEAPKPEPKITSEPPNAEEKNFDSGATVTLHGSESTSKNGAIEEFEWDIDADGEFEKRGETIDVELDFCGVLDVTLKVTDEAGQTATKSIPLSTV